MNNIEILNDFSSIKATRYFLVTFEESLLTIDKTQRVAPSEVPVVFTIVTTIALTDLAW